MSRGRYARVRREIERLRGREIDTAGDRFPFDGPARAVRCAAAVSAAVRSLGIQIRTGLVGVWAVRLSVRVGTLALALHLLASSLVAVAQPTGKVHRIGFLRHFACPDQFGLKDLRQRLGELGYSEGRYGRLCQGDGGDEAGDRCRRVLVLPTLFSRRRDGTESG